MPVDQFSALVSLLPEIEEALKQNGEALPRPIYSGAGDPSENEGQGNQSPSKQNIEATSDEDEEE